MKTPYINFPSNAHQARSVRQINDELFPQRSVFIPRAFVVALAISIASLSLAGLFIYKAHADSVNLTFTANTPVSVSPGMVYLSAQAAADAISDSAKGADQMSELHIANDGQILLRGARVKAVSGDTIKMEVDWYPEAFAFEVNTTLNTKFFDAHGAPVSLASVQTGDILTVTGMMSNGAMGPSIEAQYIREN